jgi:hypothetical protein
MTLQFFDGFTQKKTRVKNLYLPLRHGVTEGKAVKAMCYCVFLRILSVSVVKTCVLVIGPFFDAIRLF